MTPEAQRIAIAEACLDFEDLKTGHSYKYTRDYLNDLNAMAEAEAAYRGKLLPDMDGHPSLDFDTWYGHFLSAELKGGPWWSATAGQRARAFLKALGRWTD